MIRVVTVDLDRMSGVGRLFGMLASAPYGASLVRLRRRFWRLRTHYGEKTTVESARDPERGRRLRRRGLWLSCVGALLAAPFAIQNVGLDGDEFDYESYDGGAFDDAVRGLIGVDADSFALAIFAIGGPLLFWGGLKLARSRKLLFPTASELLAGDERAPIVFLRSFRDDALTIKKRVRGFEAEQGSSHESVVFEQAIGDKAQAYGPFVAIGEPGEEDPTAAASRAYVDDASWRDFVRDWMAKARAVLVLTAPTDGLIWEIGQLVETHALDKTLFIMPPEVNRRLFGYELASEKVEDRRTAILATLAPIPGLTEDALGDLDRLIALHRAGGVWYAIHSTKHLERRYELAIDLALYQMHVAAGGAAFTPR